MLWSDAPCWSTCWNGGNEFQDALTSNNLEFYLVQHPWFENDTAFADIILPISSKLELTDFNTDTLGGQWNAIIYEKAAIDPVVDSKSDWEATVAIAQKLEGFGGCYENLVERYTGNKSIEQQVEDGYKQCGGSQDFLDFEKLKVNNYQLIPTKKDYDAIPAGMFGFYEDPVRNPLQTPTGKLEYYSVPIADKWPDDTSRGPVAHWVAEGDGHYERLTSKRAEDYPFLIVSNHPRWRVHANMDDMPWFREIETCKVVGPDAYAYEPVWVNPRDAKAQNLQDGDIVSIYNERGSVLGGVRVTERIMPGVISQDHGTRVDSIVRGSGGLDRGGANNLICPSTVTSKNTAGEVTSGFLVNIKKVDVFELAKQYPDEFSNDNYTVSGGHCVIDRIVRERD
jgi:trimethylamine-N-oxide reductase (cytochrome c)